MNDIDEDQSDFANDDEIQITDLSPAGMPAHDRAQRAIELVLKGVKTPWIRYTLGILLILILLNAIFFPLYTNPAAQHAQGDPSLTLTGEPRSPQVTLAGGRAFIQSVHNLLIALQATDGHVLWQKQLSGLATLNATDQVLYCYYINQDTHSATLEALHSSDGQIIWDKTLPVSVAMSQEVQPGFILNGSTIYVALAKDIIGAFQANDGHQLWSIASGVTGYPLNAVLYALNDVVEINSPLERKTLFLNASNGRPIVQVSSHEDGTLLPVNESLIYALPGSDVQSIGRTIQVFHAPDGALRWTRTLPKGAGIIREQDGVVYLSNITYSMLAAFRGSDGYPLWTYRTSDGRAMVNNFLEQDGIVYLLQQDATLIGLRVKDGHILWRQKLAGFAGLINCCNVQLLLNQGRIFVYDVSPRAKALRSILLAAFDASNGQALWNSSLFMGTLLPLVDRLSFLQDNGRLDILNAVNGQRLWSYQAPTPVSIVGAFPGIVVLLDRNGRLSALDTDNGQPLWYYS